MAEEFIHTNYSAGDIENYLRGRMSAKEMHALERAALRDPFLADAIEGYGNAPFLQTRRHLDDIEAAILGEKQTAKIVALPAKANYRWFAAAAVAIIVCAAGGVWLAGLKNKAPEAKSFASLVTTKQNSPVPTPGQAAAGDATDIITGNTKKNNLRAAESKKAAEQGHIGTVEVAKNNGKPVVADSVKGTAFTSTLANKAEETESTGRMKIGIAIPQKPQDLLKALPSVTVDNDGNVKAQGQLVIPPGSEKVVASAGATDNNRLKSVGLNNTAPGPSYNLNTIEGYLYVNNNSVKYHGLQALGNALVTAKNGRQMAVTDSNGHFTLNTTDTLLTAEVSSAGYETRQVQLKNNSANYVFVSQAPGAAEKMEIINIQNSKNKARRLPADSLFPEGGWQSFREYVYKKLHREKDMDTSSAEITVIGASVEIEFTVDENGLARDLKITRSVNGEIDAKALEVVRQWPKWIATRKNTKGKVVIQY